MNCKVKRMYDVRDSKQVGITFLTHTQDIFRSDHNSYFVSRVKEKKYISRVDGTLPIIALNNSCLIDF